MRFKAGVRVTFTPANQTIQAAAATAFREVLGPSHPLAEPVVTSGNDGQHAGGAQPSFHFVDRALDFRTGTTWTPPLMTRDQARQIRDRMQQLLGPNYDVVLEQDHLHAEYDAKPKPSGLGATLAALLLILAISHTPYAIRSAEAQFDTLERMEQDFFTLSEPCEAEGSLEMRLEGVDYRVRRYRCGHRLWRLWEYRCAEGYWSRAVLLDQGDVNEDAYYLDAFGGLHNGRPASLVEAYRPHCGT